MSDFTSVQTQLALNSTGVSKTGKSDASSWFEAMAEAWGEALDKQATTMINRAEGLSNGAESPAEITMLTAESLRMQFLSNSSHTALTSMGSALETMARKQ